MGSTRTASQKQSLSEPDEEVVELKPPDGEGFSGTVKLFAVAQSPLVAELLKRRYTIVNREAYAGD